MGTFDEQHYYFGFGYDSICKDGYIFKNVCFFLFGELGLQANAITFGSVFLEFAFLSSLKVFTRNRQDGMAACEVSLGKHQGVAVHSVCFNTASCIRQTEIC